MEFTTQSISSSKTNEEIYNDLLEAYLFAFPLVTSEIFALNKTNVVEPNEEGVPFNQYKKGSSVYSQIFNFLGGTNLDTVYGGAYLNLQGEPLVLTKPAVEPERYIAFIK